MKFKKSLSLNTCTDIYLKINEKYIKKITIYFQIIEKLFDMLSIKNVEQRKRRHKWPFHHNTSSVDQSFMELSVNDYLIVHKMLFKIFFKNSTLHMLLFYISIIFDNYHCFLQKRQELSNLAIPFPTLLTYDKVKPWITVTWKGLFHFYASLLCRN